MPVIVKRCVCFRLRSCRARLMGVTWGGWAGAPASKSLIQGWSRLSKHHHEGRLPSWWSSSHTHTPSSRQTQFIQINVPAAATRAAQRCPCLRTSGVTFIVLLNTTWRNKCHSIVPCMQTCIYTLESPSYLKEIQPVHPKGNQP